MHVAVLEACLVYCAAEICGERIHQSTQRFRRKLLGTDLHEQVGGLHARLLRARTDSIIGKPKASRLLK